jgi:Flp pilus assembly pilin Flp
MRAFLVNLFADKSGINPVEYGLIAALIAVAAAVILGISVPISPAFFGKTANNL